MFCKGDEVGVVWGSVLVRGISELYIDFFFSRPNTFLLEQTISSSAKNKNHYQPPPTQHHEPNILQNVRTNSLPARRLGLPLSLLLPLPRSWSGVCLPPLNLPHHHHRRRIDYSRFLRHRDGNSFGAYGQEQRWWRPGLDAGFGGSAWGWVGCGCLLVGCGCACQVEEEEDDDFRWWRRRRRRRQ